MTFLSATKKVRRAATTGAAAAALAFTTALLPTGTAAAHQLDTASTHDVAIAIPACGIGMVPIVVENTWVREGPSVNSFVYYQLNSGSGFRITGGPIANNGIVWWKGHGNGLIDGWTPEHNLSCR